MTALYLEDMFIAVSSSSLVTRTREPLFRQLEMIKIVGGKVRLEYNFKKIDLNTS